MVKQRNNDSNKKPVRKGFKKNRARSRKINASTGFGTCTEQLSPFGGLLGLIKFLDLVDFAKIFDSSYIAPRRDPKLGHYSMVVGILMLLFIEFNRICHFVYIQLDAMLCGFFKLEKLPVVSTFWRYIDSMGINQGKSFLTVMSVLRERAWKQLDLYYGQINISIDTTVETLYGRLQGGRKGHNTKNRGKKWYRPVLAFIDQTREYIAGKLRAGETISGQETADFIREIKSQLPGCVQDVLLRADGEFCSWDAVVAAKTCGFRFIFANKACTPFLIHAHGTVLIKGVISNITTVFTSPWAGRSPAGLSSCVYPKNKKRTNRSNRNC